MPYRLEIYIPPAPKFISRRPPPQSRSNPATLPRQPAQTLEAKAITRMANEYGSAYTLFIWMLLVYQRIRKLDLKWPPSQSKPLLSTSTQTLDPEKIRVLWSTYWRFEIAITRLANEYGSKHRLLIWMLLQYLVIRKLDHFDHPVGEQ